ncbi:S-layer homology domain-containing protein [Paenibacillus sp.]|uniref:S-layer homology domain-containing protein n=1 Tax=Paenibacillus sp. TaxID=58172 RepID=UPI002D63A9B0|nr:S-layer homology domain-containing protein [Paenibacillus sp.]HZG86633.1 S-layer homology domain-containing protein [Paenibacillus sp.]
MNNRWKRWTAAAVAACAVAAAGWTPMPSAPERAAASALQPIQLIAEQDHIAPGGTITYRLLYHAEANAEASGGATAEVVVPAELTIVDAGDAAWDAEKRTLTWNFGGVAAGAAVAATFRAKVGEDAAPGGRIEVGATAELAAGVETAAPAVGVMVGTDTHQPFMQGYPDGTFRPDGLLTRAETAAIVARIKGLRQLEGESFEDVDASHWAYRYIQQVSAEGYMIGYNGEFRPEEPITKAELVALMLRLRGVSPVPLASELSDAIDGWSKYAVGTAETLGWLAAADEAPFAAEEPIERELAAQWIGVGLQRGPLMDGVAAVEQHFPDVPRDHPYFRWIEEASAVAHESEDRGEFNEYLIQYLPDYTAAF